MMTQIVSITMTTSLMMATGIPRTAKNPVVDFSAEIPIMETAAEVYTTETGILLNFPDGTGYYIEF